MLRSRAEPCPKERAEALVVVDRMSNLMGGEGRGGEGRGGEGRGGEGTV